jgi:hypothetical protein
MVCTAFATLSYYPENNLLDELANHAVSIISTFRPQASTGTVFFEWLIAIKTGNGLLLELNWGLQTVLVGCWLEEYKLFSTPRLSPMILSV